MQTRSLSTVPMPSSQETVTVKVIDTTLKMICDSDAFVQPPIGGRSNKMLMKTICFMIENEAQRKHVLFDCGSRKDPEKGPPYTQKMLRDHVEWFKVEKGVDEILEDGGFDLKDLDSIIWSHWHWDHIGDSTKFPDSTQIVVGKGFSDAFVPGWPNSSDGVILQSDIEGRRLREITFTDEIGGFKTHDFFGDGSFYLLDVPGHAIGHMCALARTTPTTFVFMGGDFCHFAGTFRSSTNSPVRKCPCAPLSLREKTSESASDENFFYKIATGPKSAYCDPVIAQQSVEKLKSLDMDPNVFICLAHDNILLETLPLYNTDPEKDINDWKCQGYKEQGHWGFVRNLQGSDAPRCNI